MVPLSKGQHLGQKTGCKEPKPCKPPHLHDLQPVANCTSETKCRVEALGFRV